MANPYSIAAPRIRAAINKSGESQKTIAAKLTISEQYLSDIIHGRRLVSPFVAVRLEHVLGVNAHKIMVDQTLEELRLAWIEFEPQRVRSIAQENKVTV